MSSRLISTRIGWIGIGALCAIVTLAPLDAPASHKPDGRVTRPRSQHYDGSPANRSFDFEGWVDFPGSQGQVRIEVLKQSNSTASNDAIDDSNWIQVAVATPSNTATKIDGLMRFKWSARSIKAFTNTPGSDERRWPQGGTSRVRFRAVHQGAEEFLRVFDQDGVLFDLRQLIMSDEDPNPATLPLDQRPNYLNRKKPDFVDGAAQQEETDRYYETVGTNPDGTGTEQGANPRRAIKNTLETLEDFRNRYFLSVPAVCQQTFIVNSPNGPAEVVGPHIVAKYFNHGDLGFGREMQCMHNSCDFETACYVSNYGNLSDVGEEQAIFGVRANKEESFKAVNAPKGATDAPGFSGKPFATVCMVDRGLMPLDAPNRVFFVVYDHFDSQDRPVITNNANLDEKQFNNFVPGNCLVCHGAGSSYDTATHSAKGAFFVPFDISAFQFFSSDSNNPLSLAKQEAAFKALNLLVFRTGTSNNRDILDLVNGWYGGEGMPRSTFNRTYVPPDWRKPGDTEEDKIQDKGRRELYLEVVAPYCRGCHITHATYAQDDTLEFNGVFFVADSLRFDSFDDFESWAPSIRDLVCFEHEMPNAERTARRFWRSSARSQILNRLNITSMGGCEQVVQ